MNECGILRSPAHYWRSTRVIVDVTEFPCEKPANPDKQAATWLSYKNRNTLKVLVGCSPIGALTFLSDVYKVRTIDRSYLKEWIDKRAVVWG